VNDEHGEPAAQGSDDEGYDVIEYAASVGSRLRAVRKQMRLSLQAVEAMSNQEFKASVLGAYERGERSISVPRLQRLALLYDVPVDQLLPPPPGAEGSRWTETASEEAGRPAAGDTRGVIDASGKITIDLTRLEDVQGPEREVLRKFLSMIQVQRQDFNGRVITIRADDLRAISFLSGVAPESMIRRIKELGLHTFG
jgi:transcriptional regulator with XRE-family HTH domain